MFSICDWTHERVPCERLCTLHWTPAVTGGASGSKVKAEGVLGSKVIAEVAVSALWANLRQKMRCSSYQQEPVKAFRRWAWPWFHACDLLLQLFSRLTLNPQHNRTGISEFIWTVIFISVTHNNIINNKYDSMYDSLFNLSYLKCLYILFSFNYFIWSNFNFKVIFLL